MSNDATLFFGEICREVKITSKNPKVEGYDKYIGLEHLDSGSLKIKRWGLLSDASPSFTRVFKKGHILLGKRRPYLKKAAIAEFDGLCSGDIIVLEERNDSPTNGLLPFIIQTDDFWSWAIQTSSGSLSPRTKFSALEKFKISLPQGRDIASIKRCLNKSEETLTKADDLITAKSNLKVSLLREWFSSRADEWTTQQLGDLFEVQLGKMLSRKAKQGLNPKPYLANFNVQWNALNLAELNEMDFNEKEMNKFRLKKGDILVCEGGEIGRSAIWNEELDECYYQKALHRLRPIETGKILPEFIILYFEYKFLVSGDFSAHSTATTIAHIPREKLLRLPISYPPLKEQEKIVSLSKSLDAMSAELANNKQTITDLKKALLWDLIYV